MKIEAYDFGAITVDGRIFTTDLKIVRGAVLPGWWRQEGHNLLPEDIEDIITAAPDILIVGTGHDGLMRVSRAVEQRLAGAGIKLIAKPTHQAVDEFNRLAGSHSIAFAAHLTC